MKDKPTCPECGEPWTEEDLENIGDIGCPSCKKIFDVEDFEKHE